MSGIEVIGFVIGFWPVFSNVVSVYRTGRDSRSRQHFVGKINMYRLQFRGFVEKLLLGDEELTEDDRVRLTDPAGQDAANAWQDKGLQARIKERLGPETFEAIQFTTSRMLELLKSLEAQLKRGEVNFVSSTSGLGDGATFSLTRLTGNDPREGKRHGPPTKNEPARITISRAAYRSTRVYRGPTTSGRRRITRNLCREPPTGGSVTSPALRSHQETPCCPILRRIP